MLSLSPDSQSNSSRQRLGHATNGFYLCPSNFLISATSVNHVLESNAITEIPTTAKTGPILENTSLNGTDSNIISVNKLLVYQDLYKRFLL